MVALEWGLDSHRYKENQDFPKEKEGREGF